MIKNYTTAGGSYVVARDNFGPRVAQVAAVALMIDYIVTVAVQCSAGTAALTSALPSLVPLTVPITIGVVLFLIYGNLRGIREAGALFAVPTYFFVAMLGLTILVGVGQEIAGTLHLVAQPPTSELVDHRLGTQGSGILMGLAFLTLLRAYANGGSSLTGLEAISNGVTSFRRPEATNARFTLVMMSSILTFLLLGTTFLASWTHALPYAKGTPTVVSQEVLAVFGTHGVGHVIYYVVLAATVLILYTGGNTSFNGFPFLANYVAGDRFLPRQLTKRGHRLAFSNGIIVLGAVALTLIIVFKAQVNGLISLYAIGVFTGFTLAGAGMVAKHRREQTGRWRLGVALNGLSATVTAVVVVVFLLAKFTEGAWIIAVVGPLMYVALVGDVPRAKALVARGAEINKLGWTALHYVALLRIRRQYGREDRAFAARTASGAAIGAGVRSKRIIVLVDSYDIATEKALEYCQTLNVHSVRAVHFDIDPKITAELEAQWATPSPATLGISLEIAECDDRRLDRAALELVADTVRDPEVFCMVMLPRRGVESRLQRLLHDRTADAISKAVSHVPRTAATIVPYWVDGDELDVEGLELHDTVATGGIRHHPHLEADLTLEARSVGTEAIGDLAFRQRAHIAGRVRSITISRRESFVETRCVIADPTGAITLVFHGRPTIPGLERGTRLMVDGMVGTQGGEAVILNPDYEIVALPAGRD